MPQWTTEQKSAITADGGTLLVSAAAGSGKTSVLSARVIRALTDPAEHAAASARSAKGHQRYTKAAVLSYWKNCYASLLPQTQPVPQARGDFRL